MTAGALHTEMATTETDSLARGARVTFLGHLAGRGLGFLLTLVLTRWLGASEYGVFILALAIFHFVSIFSDMGLRYGALRFVAMAEGRRDQKESRRVITTVVLYSLTASLVGMVILGASSPVLVNWFRQPAFKWIIPLMALSLPFTTVGTVFKSVLQAFKRLDAVAVLQHLVDPLVRIGVFVALVAMGWGVGAAVSSHLAAGILVCATALLWFLPRMPLGSDHWTPIKGREILAFSVPLSVAHVASVSMQWADTLFLGYFAAARDVGIYGAASRMASLGGMTLFAVSMSFAPQANQLYGRGDIGGIRRLYQQVTRWLITVNLPILVLMVTFAPWFLGLFGAEFRNGWPVLLILAFAIFITVATGPAGDVSSMAGRSNILLAVGMVLAILNLGLHWALVPRWGVLGAAVATAFTIAISNVTNLVLGWWFLGLQPYSVRLVKPLMIGLSATVLTAAAAFAMQIESVQGLLAFLLIWAVAYPVALMRLVADSEDRALVRTLLAWPTPISGRGR